MGILGWLFAPREVERVVEKIVERVIVVPLNGERVGVYRATDPYYRTMGAYSNWCRTPEPYHGKFYESCAQAFAEAPKADVERVEVWRVGNEFVDGFKGVVIEVQPKPDPLK